MWITRTVMPPTVLCGRGASAAPRRRCEKHKETADPFRFDPFPNKERYRMEDLWENDVKMFFSTHFYTLCG